jgi:hypothetical protein
MIYSNGSSRSEDLAVKFHPDTKIAQTFHKLNTTRNWNQGIMNMNRSHRSFGSRNYSQMGIGGNVSGCIDPFDACLLPLINPNELIGYFATEQLVKSAGLLRP